MATTENNGLLKYKDANGNLYLLYPITKAELVDGLDDALAAKANKKVPAASGNLALLDANGNLMDSGKRPTPSDIGAEEIGYASAGAYYGDVSKINAYKGSDYIAMNTTVWFDSASGTTGLPADGEGSGIATLTGSGVDGGGTMTLRYTKGHTAQRILRIINGSLGWDEWQWINPPMNVGVEYRTTEQFGGVPVYTKLMNLGSIAADKTIEIPGYNYIRHSGTWGNSSLPLNGSNESYYLFLEINSGGKFIKMHAGGIAGASGDVFVQLWYTK